jgi:hypothetical protein
MGCHCLQGVDQSVVETVGAVALQRSQSRPYKEAASRLDRLSSGPIPWGDVGQVYELLAPSRDYETGLAPAVGGSRNFISEHWQKKLADDPSMPHQTRLHLLKSTRQQYHT